MAFTHDALECLLAAFDVGADDTERGFHVVALENVEHFLRVLRRPVIESESKLLVVTRVAHRGVEDDRV